MIFGRKNKNKKQIILNTEKLEKRVALLNNGKLEEYEIERASENKVAVGSIYLGKIVNLEPSLQAAFVDIGGDRNAFLHYWDMIPASDEMAENIGKKKDPKKEGTKSSIAQKLIDSSKNRSQLVKELASKQSKKIKVEDIPKLFKAGSLVLVQVTKGPIGTKGPRITTNISIPGRYLVLLPFSDHLGLSSKIEDKKERTRLRKILRELDIPDSMGVICRTAGEGRKSQFFSSDLEMLLDFWHKVEDAMNNKPEAPLEVYREPTLAERTVRDLLTDDIDEIIVDNEAVFKNLQEMLNKFSNKKNKAKIKHHRKADAIFDYYNVQEQIADIFLREVQLPSGGYICIDETEALIAIDVNTGKKRNKDKDQPETILETNMEAAEEVARQLKLRNIGGLVVIDFIDMRSRKDRNDVYSHMKKLLKDDKAKTKTLAISRLGLMEMTRQREQESLKETVFDYCPYCNGSGRVKSPVTMSVEIQRRLQELLKRNRGKKGLAFRVIIHPSILARLKNEDSSLLIELEDKYGKNLSFRGDAALHLEEFRIVDPDTGEEY